MCFECMYIGKGIIIPTILFVKKYKAEKMYHDDPYGTIEQIFSDNNIHPGYKWFRLGHDAFDINKRCSMCDIFDGVDGYEDTIQMIIDESDDDLLFIGYYNEVLLSSGCQMSAAPSAIEIIYSMPILLPSIIKSYISLKDKECNDLEETFDQKPLIWTFGDCVCCT